MWQKKNNDNWKTWGKYKWLEKNYQISMDLSMFLGEYLKKGKVWKRGEKKIRIMQMI